MTVMSRAFATGSRLIPVMVVAVVEATCMTTAGIPCRQGVCWEVRDEDVIARTRSAVIHFEPDYLSVRQMIESAERIERGVREVETYLGPEFMKRDLLRQPLAYFVRDGDFISNARGGKITLAYLRGGAAPYVHETVHLLASYNLSQRWLAEGLAVFLNDELGGYPAFPNYGDDLDGLSGKMLENPSLTEVLSFDNGYTRGSRVGREKRRAFYVLSGSLVQYIEHRYGRRKLLTLYQSGDCRAILGVSFEQLRSDWLGYLGGGRL